MLQLNLQRLYTYTYLLLVNWAHMTRTLLPSILTHTIDESMDVYIISIFNYEYCVTTAFYAEFNSVKKCITVELAPKSTTKFDSYVQNDE